MTNNPDCPIISYAFTETTTTQPGLTTSGCSIPDASLSCRTIIVPTVNARLNEGSPPPFTYKFVITALGGATKTFEGMIEVTTSGLETPTLSEGLCADYVFGSVSLYNQYVSVSKDYKHFTYDIITSNCAANGYTAQSWFNNSHQEVL